MLCIQAWEQRAWLLATGRHPRLCCLHSVYRLDPVQTAPQGAGESSNLIRAGPGQQMLFQVWRWGSVSAGHRYRLSASCTLGPGPPASGAGAQRCPLHTGLTSGPSPFLTDQHLHVVCVSHGGRLHPEHHHRQQADRHGPPGGRAGPGVHRWGPAQLVQYVHRAWQGPGPASRSPGFTYVTAGPSGGRRTARGQQSREPCCIHSPIHSCPHPVMVHSLTPPSILSCTHSFTHLFLDVFAHPSTHPPHESPEHRLWLRQLVLKARSSRARITPTSHWEHRLHQRKQTHVTHIQTWTSTKNMKPCDWTWQRPCCFHSGCTSSRSHPQCVKVLVSPHLHRCCLFLWIAAVPVGGRWYLCSFNLHLPGDR